MASRHRSGLIVVSRDHVPEMLDAYIPSATQAVGRDDLTGRGHFQNSMFWDSIVKSNGVVRLTNGLVDRSHELGNQRVRASEVYLSNHARRTAVNFVAMGANLLVRTCS